MSRIKEFIIPWSSHEICSLLVAVTGPTSTFCDIEMQTHCTYCHNLASYCKDIVNIVVLCIGIAKPLEILLFCDFELQNHCRYNDFVFCDTKLKDACNYSCFVTYNFKITSWCGVDSDSQSPHNHPIGSGSLDGKSIVEAIILVSSYAIPPKKKIWL